MIAVTLLALLFILASVEYPDPGFITVGICYAVAVVAMFTVDKTPEANIPESSTAEAQPAPEIPAEPGSFVLHNTVYQYPTLLTRYKALLIDFLLVGAVLVFLMVAIGETENHTAIMVTAWLIVFLGYEPIFTISSATIGQRLMKIRVRSIANPSQPIKVWQSYLRFVVKGALGWLSFLSINFNPQHRAIHDMAGASVMISVKPKE